MNEVVLSGILNGELTSVSNDGVKFNVVNRSGKNGGVDEFICLAYGGSAKFLEQHAGSGQRVVIQGRLSSEKLDTSHYHTAITASRILSLGDSSSGLDYSYALVSGLASSKGVTYLKTNTAVLNLDITNKREFRSREGEVQEYTTYLGGTLWSNLAEEVAKKFSFPLENVHVVIDGVLKPRSYEKDGEVIHKIDVWANTFDTLTSGGTSVVAQKTSSVPQKSSATPPPRRNKSPQLDEAPF